MSITINAPTDQVTVYDVAGQDAVQLNFDFDPTLFRTEGTTLVIEYEGHEIRLENFFNADGTSGVESFLTQDGQAFSAADLLAAVMGSEPGTGEDIETAAGNAGGGSGAGEYDDNPGNLYDGLDAMGDQPDAYAHEPTEFLEGNESDYEAGGSTIIYDPGDIWWWMDSPGGRYLEVRQYQGSGETDPTEDYTVLASHNRSYATYVGTSGVDTLVLTDDDTVGFHWTPGGVVPTDAYGDALLLEDDLSFPGDPGQPRIEDIEVIQAGAGHDVIDLSSDTLPYGDVTIYGGDGNDVIWANSGNDTLYGESGNDSMIGGLGDDQLFGGTGDDVIKGVEGNDLLNGGAGSDLLFGGSGDDVINAGTGAHDVVTLGAGQDTLSIDASSLTDTGGIPDADPFGTGSTVEVLDFSTEDSLDLNGLGILEMRETNITGGAATDLQLHVSDGAGHETWIVLTDTALSADLSPEMQAYIATNMIP